MSEYLCIDLKSFYASVECAERGLNPFSAKLVVADAARGRGAICLAASPAIKRLGVKNRCRIFQIPPEIEYITAPPRMSLYMKYSADIYSIYLRFIDKDDIYVYSVDECFINITPYLKIYNKNSRELAAMLMSEIRKELKIPAAAGIGTNLFLAKVALDITAKHAPDGIGYLDEENFRRTIWHHTPITDVWNIGRGVARRLEQLGAFDLYDVSRLPEELLYKEFGINAGYLIDHANGIEPCTIKEIHEYEGKSHSLSTSQILFENYCFEDALLILNEMTDTLILELCEKGLTAGGAALYVGYADDSLPHTGKSKRLDIRTDSREILMREFEDMFLTAASRTHLIRRIGITLCDVRNEDFSEIGLFTGIEKEQREHDLQSAIIAIKNRYGKNSLIRASALLEKSTAQERNMLIGGHKAG